MSRALPSFDLVVATVGRTDELGRLLDSIDAQEYEPAARDRRRPERRRARRRRRWPGGPATLVHLRADARVCRVRETSGSGRSRPTSWRSPTTTASTRRACSTGVADAVRGGSGSRRHRPGERRTRTGARRPPGRRTRRCSPTTTSGTARMPSTIFLRRELVARVGDFDERLGLGSGEPWSSGEEIDYLIRAVRAGARIEYDPDARRAARRSPRRRAHRAPRRRERRLPAPQARLPARGRRPDARCGPSAALVLALVGLDLPRARYYARDAARTDRRLPRRQALEELRVTVEPRLEREPLDRAAPSRGRVRRVGRRARALTASASASGSGGSSRSKPSGCGTPMPASSPTSSGTPPLRG